MGPTAKAKKKAPAALERDWAGLTVPPAARRNEHVLSGYHEPLVQIVPTTALRARRSLLHMAEEENLGISSAIREFLIVGLAPPAAPSPLLGRNGHVLLERWSLCAHTSISKRDNPRRVVDERHDKAAKVEKGTPQTNHLERRLRQHKVYAGGVSEVRGEKCVVFCQPSSTRCGHSFSMPRAQSTK